MATPDLTPEEFANWLTPSAAVQILESAFGTDSRSYIAKHTLLERLRGGRTRAVAKEFVVDSGLPSEHAVVEPASWHHVNEDDIFWTSGDLTYRTHDNYRRTEHHRFYHVRFEPSDVRSIARNVSPPPEATTPPEPEQKGLPVSEMQLQAWFVFYKAITKPAEETEDYAWAHAKRCFPNHTVSRDSIRALRGNQKRGPKRKSGSAE